MQPGLNRGGTGAAAKPAAAAAPRRAVQGPMMPPKPATRVAKPSSMEAEAEAAYEWAPPTEQRGDGKTSLNAKLGY